MKRSWIVRMDEKAVSPVIATILMVAITVVLAAVLYVMVTGLIGGGGTQPPAVTFGPAEAVGAGVYTVDVAGVDRSVSLTSFQVVLQNISAAPTTLGTADLADGTLYNQGGITLAFDDLQNDGRFNQGDFFTLSGVASGKSYNIILLWKQTGGRITEREVHG